MTRPCAARRGHDQAVAAWCHLAHELVNGPRADYGLIRNHLAEEIHMLTLNRVTLGLFVFALAACSGENGNSATDEKHDHVWKTQTDALDKAKQVAGLVNEAASRHLITDE